MTAGSTAHEPQWRLLKGLRLGMTSSEWLVVVGALVFGLVSLAVAPATEPCFHGDETRHVMSGVFVRDFIRDLPLAGPRDYAIRYYLQYPALGFLVWPPLHYLIEGAFMLVFGTSFLGARFLVLIESSLACLVLFRIVRRTHGLETAFLTVALFRASPLVFMYSRVVMLEVPTLLMALVSINAFLKYLESDRARDVWTSGATAAR